ncbi:uncharacterized protein [Musca autumnalis]|uniref:uncharacterized protein n=1 Tax=Musca autumnalis TaxID=221902 RepID=UPI003CF0EB9A
MRLITTLLCLLIIVLMLLLVGCNFNYLRNWIKTKLMKSDDCIVKKSIKDTQFIKQCDENKLLQQFARLYIISPERIVLLLTEKPLFNTCNKVSDILAKINAILIESRPLPTNNLYVKLYNALRHFNDSICQRGFSIKGDHLTDYEDCIQDLHEDLIQCEGPPDWFEKKNEAVVCQYYNDIVNCQYIKAAMLCGLKPALLLRTFSMKIMQEIVTYKCKVSKSLPQVDEAMSGDTKKDFSFIFIFVVFYLVSY